MKKYQEEVDKWFKENDWKYFSPLSILARLYEECGEFARLVNPVRKSGLSNGVNHLFCQFKKP